MKRESLKRAAFCLAAFAALIAVWEICVGYFGMFRHMLPAPSSVAAYLFSACAF